MAAEALTNVVCLLQNFRHGVRRAKSTPDPAQAFQIAEVVTNVSDILQGNVPALRQLQEKREFVLYARVIFIDTQFLHPGRDGWTVLGADNANADAFFAQ